MKLPLHDLFIYLVTAFPFAGSFTQQKVRPKQEDMHNFTHPNLTLKLTMCSHSPGCVFTYSKANSAKT